MNVYVIVGKTVAFVLSFYMITIFVFIFAKAYVGSAYESNDVYDLWNVDSRISDSFSVYKYLDDNGYISDSVSFSDFDYIFVLTHQLCTMTDRVKPSLALAMIAVESNFDSNAEHNSAKGLMQLIPAYHTSRMKMFMDDDQTDLDFFNPRLNIVTGLDYMNYILYEVDNDVAYALMWYNQGAISASIDYLDMFVTSSYAKKIMELSDNIDSIFTEGGRMDVCITG